MSYTVHDWFIDQAEVLVRIPYGGNWIKVWVPFAALSENNYPDEWGERMPPLTRLMEQAREYGIDAEDEE